MTMKMSLHGWRELQLAATASAGVSRQESRQRPIAPTVAFVMRK
jgi:hypothetical protein